MMISISAKANHSRFFSSTSEQENKIVHSIQFETLYRSREFAIRRVLQTVEGTPFSSKQFDEDLHDLYNTQVLYDISAEVKSDSDGQLNIVIHLKDKWTLIPFFGAQGGGGSVVYGGGVSEANVFGTLTSAQYMAYNYNGAFCYDFLLSQDYLVGSRYRASAEVLSEVYRVQSKSIDATQNGSYIWARNSKQVTLGVRPKRWLVLETQAAAFQDGLNENNGTTADVYSGTQYRISPQVTLGEVNQFNFLEDGSEGKIKFSSTNVFGASPNVQSINVSFKQVWILGATNNIGYQLFAGAMTSAPLPYLYSVGGYFNLRGYIDNRQVGPYQLSSIFEYRTLMTEKRLHFFDLDQVVVQGVFFQDLGSAWGASFIPGDDRAKKMNLLWSMGTGIRFNFVKIAGAILRFDLARTIQPDEGFGFTFGAGQFF